MVRVHCLNGDHKVARSLKEVDLDSDMTRNQWLWLGLGWWTWLQQHCSTPTCLYFDLYFNTAYAVQYVYCTCTCVTQRQPRQLWQVLNRKDNPVTALPGRNDPRDWYQMFSQSHLRFGPRMVLKQQRCKSGYGEGLTNNKRTNNYYFYLAWAGGV